MAKIYLDSAEKNIGEIINDFNLSGATSNPKILLKDRCSEIDFLKRVPDQKIRFVQIIASNTKEQVIEATGLVNIDKDVVVKIPATKDGLAAIFELSKLGVKTLATAIYSFQQAILAMNSGAKYVAPYLNRMLTLDYRGYEIVSQIQSYKEKNSIDCEVICASFKTLDQIIKVIEHGVDAVTVPMDLFNQWIENESANKAVEEFAANHEELCRLISAEKKLNID